MKKFILISVLILCVLIMNTEIFAVGTTSGTLVTNRAIASGDNFTSTSNGIGTNVLSIVGGNWPGEVAQNVNASQVITNTAYLTNLGNTAFTFNIKVTNYQRSGAATSGPWSYTVYTQNNFVTPAIGSTSSNSASFAMPINEGANKRVDLVVTVDGGATGGWERWSLMAKTATSKQNTDNYTGDNGTVYGGPIGVGWGDSVADALLSYDVGTPANAYWQLNCQTPVITITKSIDNILTTTAAGLDNIAIPGATITYRIDITNSGTGVATSLKVRDLIDTANLTYLGGSMTYTNKTGAETFQTNVNLPNIQWSNTSANYASYSRTIFTFKAVIR